VLRPAAAAVQLHAADAALLRDAAADAAAGLLRE